MALISVSVTTMESLMTLVHRGSGSLSSEDTRRCSEDGSLHHLERIFLDPNIYFFLLKGSLSSLGKDSRC